MRNNKLVEVSKKLYELFIKHKDNRDLAIGEFIGWLDNDSNLVENRVSQTSEPTCEWKAEKHSIAEYDGLHDGYKTNCGYTISDSYIISAPHYKYCPFCGKPIHEQP